MRTFRYEGHDKIGRPRKGHVEAETIESASALLRADGVFVLSLEESSNESQKTVLDHGGDVEEETTFLKTKADEEAEAEPVKPSAFEADVVEAVKLSREIRVALGRAGVADGREPSPADSITESVLKELLAELALREIERRRSP